jgi:hypothetical protein
MSATLVTCGAHSARNVASDRSTSSALRTLPGRSRQLS